MTDLLGTYLLRVICAGLLLTAVGFAVEAVVCLWRRDDEWREVTSREQLREAMRGQR